MCMMAPGVLKGMGTGERSCMQEERPKEPAVQGASKLGPDSCSITFPACKKQSLNEKVSLDCVSESTQKSNHKNVLNLFFHMALSPH